MLLFLFIVYNHIYVIDIFIKLNGHLDGITIPAGMEVAINIFGIQRNEELFENPTSFNPDRFLPENISKLNNASFLAFGKGPRDCIGKKLDNSKMFAFVYYV